MANFPVAYCGLKIITSLTFRFPDFQRKNNVFGKVCPFKADHDFILCTLAI
ncbi:hypothetical protein BAZMOX_464333_0 [methanotrophic endosymbiont of Bathymodiolus azoricus (Menez Gwen)]|nr:hypothetical protein BAZMOX_464333_0 [methanotrophic endosymbiont of Bathymodiolus azoricus (Menez Gwen)]